VFQTDAGYEAYLRFVKQYADKPLRDVPALHRHSSIRLNASCNERFAQRKVEDSEKAENRSLSLDFSGTYALGVHGSTSSPMVVEAGKIQDVLLGAVQVEGSFQIFDAAGKRLGYYEDRLLLCPGSYTVKVSDGPTFEGLEVEGGKVTVLK